MGDKIPNPYKAAVTQARAQAKPHADSFQGMLDQAVTAMEGGAWISTSSAAETFGNGLDAQKQALGKLPAAVVAEFDEILGREPDEVEPGSWQTRWHNL